MDYTAQSQIKKTRKRNILIPLVSTLVFYVICYLCIGRAQPSTFYLHPRLILDLLLQIAIGYVLFSFSHWTFLFLIEQLALMVFIYFGHSLKIHFLGSPLNIDDMYSLTELFLVISLRRRILLIAPVAIFFVSFIVNFRFQKVVSSVAIAILLVSLATVSLYPGSIMNAIEGHFGYNFWEPWKNLSKSGGTVYFLHQGAKFLNERIKSPNEDDVELALEQLGINAERFTKLDNVAEFKRRNVYVILVESLWDPLLMEGVTFNADPWDDNFRKLWNQTGNSCALSPAFAGTTCNSEFELFVGQPTNMGCSQVRFQTGIKNKIPALPKLLSQYGYQTYAFHPNRPAFFNRVNAYSRLGFESYYSIRDFKLDDMNAYYLSDESLYRQAMQIVNETDKGGPKLVYILTLTGHTPYLLNKAKRPTYIKSDTSFEYFDRYLNLTYYTTKETEEFIRLILKRDPDALIVAMGDHLPNFGPEHRVYVECGLFKRSLENFNSQMYKTRASVPLIIIDGKSGPLNVGTMVIYEIPGKILELLKFPKRTTFDVFKSYNKLHVRTLGEAVLVFDDTDNTAVLCKTGIESEKCKYAFDWLENIKVVDEDILVGKQFSIKKISELNGL